MDCKKWLKEYLALNGSVLVKQVKADAIKTGFTVRELLEAKTVNGVRTFCHNFNWFWYIREEIYERKHD